MSQGYIGYHLQQALGVAMHKAYKRWHVATVVTQMEVDPDDPAFAHPTKPIGPFLTKEQADALKAKHPDMSFMEDSGRGWRRVVASPEPKKIVEAPSILNLSTMNSSLSPAEVAASPSYATTRTRAPTRALLR
jgi:carbamate kinase